MERNDTKSKMKDKIYKELKVSFQSIEQKIKDLELHKAELELKCELYGQCLAEHLLSSGSDIVKGHLETANREIQECDVEIEKLKLQKDAYKIEIEIFENNIK